MESSHPNEDRRRRRHWEWLLLLLALLISFACIFLSTWVSLNTWPDRVKASMLAGEGADYKRSDQEDVAFGSLNPEVGAEAATDAARLQLTPEAGRRSTPAGIALLPPTPPRLATSTPPLGVVTIIPSLTLPPSTAPAGASPTGTSPSSASPTATQSPVSTNTPTSVPPPLTDTPTLIPPTSTETVTTVPPTPTETATTPPPTPTDTPEPTDTPHVHPPTDTPEPPTDTPTPTPTPTNTPVAPTVLAIRPQAALLGSSVPVTITGNNFVSGSGLEATLNSTPLLNVTWIDASTLTAAVPSTMLTGTYTLTVTNPGPASDNLPDAFRVFTYTLPFSSVCSGDVGTTDPTGCDNGARAPDGLYDGINDATGVITFDFGSPGITNGPGYDLVFYERAYNGGIQLDYITIECSTDGSTWTTLFNWDGFPGGVTGTNIDSYAADGETYNEFIPAYDLYPGIPGGPNSGIAIDIGAVGIDSIQYIRVTRPDGSLPRPAEAAEIDAIVPLN